MIDDNKPLMGFTAPMIRNDPWARPEPPKQRRPIGFVHFGEPEPDPAVCVDAYVKIIMDGDGDDRDQPFDDQTSQDGGNPELPF